MIIIYIIINIFIIFFIHKISYHFNYNMGSTNSCDKTIIGKTMNNYNVDENNDTVVV